MYVQKIVHQDHGDMGMKKRHRENKARWIVISKAILQTESLNKRLIEHASQIIRHLATQTRWKRSHAFSIQQHLDISLTEPVSELYTVMTSF